MISKNILPLIWFAAFLCSPFFINAWELWFLCGAIALLSLWSVLSLARASDRGVSIPQSWPLRFMGAFWLIAFISVITSDIINISFMAFCFFSVMPLSFLVFASTGQREYYKIIGLLMAIVLAGMAIWALVQFIFLNEYFKGQARHPLMNPNSLAALFSLGFFCALGAVFIAQEKWHRIGAVALTILIFSGMVATGSRGAFFALLPMLVLFLFFIRSEVVQYWKWGVAIFAGCLLAFMLSIFGDYSAQNLIARVATTITLSDDDLTNNRWALWAATIEMIKARPIFGTGIGTYFLYFPEFRLLSDQKGAYFAHSDPLQFWAELGFLGPIIFYAFAISVLVRTISAVKASVTSQQRIFILAPFFALGACVMHTHVTFNFSNFSILMAVGFILGAWFWATQEVLQTSVKTISFPKSFTPFTRRFALALPFIAVVGFFTAYVFSEHYTNKARVHLMTNELEAFADDVMLANKLSFDSNYRSYLLAVTVPISLLESSGNQLSRAQKKDIFDQAIEYLTHVESINPRSASALFYLAKIQEMVPTDFVGAELRPSQEYYESAIKIDPLHIASRIELSKIYEQEQGIDKAIDLVNQGVKYRYSSAKALDLYLRQAELYLKSGKMEEAKKAIQRHSNFRKEIEKANQKKKLGAFGLK